MPITPLTFPYSLASCRSRFYWSDTDLPAITSMFSSSSLYTCWLPRVATTRKILVRTSTSRFSVKVARFLFWKERLHESAPDDFSPLPTQSHYSTPEAPRDMHELSRNFVLTLEPEHRKILQQELSEADKTSTTTLNIPTVLPSQLVVVFLETGLPYIGFGFVDNFVMLVAGETIETFFGAALCLSTMAAAGLGNAVSDVMGIGLADRIERTCGRFLALLGISAPKLTTEQWRSRTVHKIQLTSKVICIFLGCVLGMCPLLFRDTSSKKSKSGDHA